MIPEFARTRGLFVAGTDTGVGKTLVTGALARGYRQTGLKVGVFKPIATGCRRDGADYVSEDEKFLSYCVSQSFPQEMICPQRYELPLAPMVAEREEARCIDFEAIARAFNFLVGECNFVLVEGIGGILSPLRKGLFVLDLIKAFGLPVLLIGRDELGTLNHTLLAYEQLMRNGLQIRGILLSQTTIQGSDISTQSNAGILREILDIDWIDVIDYDTKSCVSPARLGPRLLENLSRIPWLSPTLDQEFQKA